MDRIPIPAGSALDGTCHAIERTCRGSPIERCLSVDMDPDGIDTGRILCDELLWNKDRRASSTGGGSRWDRCGHPTTPSQSADNQWFVRCDSRSIPSGSTAQAHTCHKLATLSYPTHKKGSPNRATPPLKSYGKNQVSPRPFRKATFRATHAGKAAHRQGRLRPSSFPQARHRSYT